MTTYPLPISTAAIAGGAAPLARQPTLDTPPDGSWRYTTRPRSRVLVALAIALSAGMHLGILFGIRPEKPKPIVRANDDAMIIRIVLPDLKDLEEPEPEPTEGGRSEDLSTLVPMQADIPQLPKPTDFVQQFDASSLLERPDFSDMKITVIPESIRRGGAISESMGKVFNLADLDRHPEPVFQPSPVMPFEAKRDGLSGEVRVQFVVDTEGKVVNAFVVESTNRRFEEAALTGVSKWRFRPGIKGGKKVNTRMAVPIRFQMGE